MASVSVESVAVTPAVVARNSPDTLGVYGQRSTQYVIATVTADGTPIPAPDDIGLATDDGTVRPDQAVGGMGGELWTYGAPYGDDGVGWLAFVVSKPLETSAAAITQPGGEHPLPADALAGLTRPPTTFTVDSVTAPAEIAADEPATLEVTVTNEGSVPGTWVGALNRSGPSVAYIPETAVRLTVPAGGSRTWTYTNTVEDRFTDQPTGTLEFHLEWRDGSRSTTTEVTDA